MSLANWKTSEIKCTDCQEWSHKLSFYLLVECGSFLAGHCTSQNRTAKAHTHCHSTQHNLGLAIKGCLTEVKELSVNNKEICFCVARFAKMTTSQDKILPTVDIFFPLNASEANIE